MWRLSVVLLFLFSTSSCSENAAPSPTQRPVLRIGSIQYSGDQFSSRWIERARNYDLSLLRNGDLVERLKQDVLRELTIEGLLLLWESKLSAPISKSALSSKILEKQAQYPSAKAFRLLQKSLGIEPKDFEQRVRAEMIKDLIVDSFQVEPQVDFKKIKQRYWVEKDSFMEDGKIKIQQIVTSTEHEASTVLQALKKGADFGDLAEKYSIAEEASSRGKLGWIGKGILPLFDAAFKLPVMRTSSIRKSPYGFHIMRVLEKKRRRKVPLDEVKEQVRQKSVRAQKAQLYKDWLEGQLAATPIQVNTKALENAEILPQRKYQ